MAGTPKGQKLDRIVFYAQPSLRDWIESEAARRRVTVSSFIRERFARDENDAHAAAAKRAA